jgi:hypothetical protein
VKVVLTVKAMNTSMADGKNDPRLIKKTRSPAECWCDLSCPVSCDLMANIPTIIIRKTAIDFVGIIFSLSITSMQS